MDVNFFPGELPLIEEELSKSYEIDNTSIKLDGVLFYYKEMFYHKGFTPFVGWLKPYMVPEVLKIPVAEKYMQMRPETYVSFHSHMQKIQKNVKEKFDVS